MTRRLLVVLLFTACIATAAAQAPPSGFGAAVSIDGPSTGEVSLDRAQSFTFEVTNDGADSGPLNEQNQARVVVAVNGIPAGWSVAATPAAFRLGPGASQDVQVTVTVTAEADVDTASLSVDVTLTSALEDVDPLLGQIPGQAQTATASAELSVERVDSVTRGLLESIGSYIYVILFALLAAVLVTTKLVVDNRRVTVALSSQQRSAVVKPGGRAALRMTVRNIGRQDDTVVFQVSPVGDAWAAFLPVAELELHKGQEEELHLVIIAPDNAEAGSRQEVLVSAHSAQGPKHPASITFEAVVE